MTGVQTCALPISIELSTWLTATKPNAEKRDVVNIAQSADQIAAQHLGLYTVLPSLELGTRKNENAGTGQEGLNNRYYTTGNYRSATQPLPVEVNPSEVYKRLFAYASRRRKNRAAQPSMPNSLPAPMAMTARTAPRWIAACSTWYVRAPAICANA